MTQCRVFLSFFCRVSNFCPLCFFYFLLSLSSSILRGGIRKFEKIISRRRRRLERKHLVSRLRLIKGEGRKELGARKCFSKDKTYSRQLSFARLFNFRVIEVNYKPRVVPRKIAEGNLTACVFLFPSPSSIAFSLSLSHPVSFALVLSLLHECRAQR